MRLYFPKDSNFELGFRSEITYNGYVSIDGGDLVYMDFRFHPYEKTITLALDPSIRGRAMVLNLSEPNIFRLFEKSVKEMQKTRLKKRFYGVPDTISCFRASYPFVCADRFPTADDFIILIELTKVYLDISILSCVKKEDNPVAQNPSKLG